MNAKKKTLPKPRIEIFQYNGYNGGFAQSRELLWKCVVVGVKGQRRDADKDSWHGNEAKHYAISDANDWKKFTGWPVFDLGRVTSQDDPPKDSRN